MHIATFSDAIEFLGGNGAVAEWLEIPDRHVAMMKSRGRPSRGFLLHFYLTLTHRGASVEPAALGLVSFDQLLMPLNKVRRRRTRGRAGTAAGYAEAA